MSARFGKGQLRDAFVILSLLCVCVFLVVFPEESVEAAKNGVTLCLNVIVPSLFPFFILSALTLRLRYAEKLGKVFEPLMRPLFGVGGQCSCALILGFIGGYPIGAKTVISLYQNGSCTKEEAERLLAFCNNSGPAFVLGVVGSGVFANGTAGLILYLAHILASLTIGVFLRFIRRGKASYTKRTAASAEKKPISFFAAFTESVTGSFSSVMSICAFVIFFTVFIRMLFLTGIVPFLSHILGTVLAPVGFDDKWAEKLITGVIEISSGVWSLRDAPGGVTAGLSMAAFMLGWAGLSVHCQVLSFLNGSGLSPRTYIMGKTAHGILSAALIPPLCRLFSFRAPTAAFLAQQVGEIASASFGATVRASVISALLVFAFFFSISKMRLPKETHRLR